MTQGQPSHSTAMAVRPIAANAIQRLNHVPPHGPQAVEQRPRIVKHDARPTSLPPTSCGMNSPIRL